MRIHHLALRTGDLARLERFYAGTLGIAVLRRDAGRSVWLDAAGTIVMLERREASEPSVDARSLELVCFAIAPGAHDAVVARLAAAGVAIEARTAFTLYFRDPDGRRVGVSSYPDAPDRG
ncbi:MAG: VOC family protein [Labilithrix sp.]|nr:VOC family protein [Labilithrix sp.]